MRYQRTSLPAESHHTKMTHHTAHAGQTGALPGPELNSNPDVEYVGEGRHHQATDRVPVAELLARLQPKLVAS